MHRTYTVLVSVLLACNVLLHKTLGFWLQVNLTPTRQLGRQKQPNRTNFWIILESNIPIFAMPKIKKKKIPILALSFTHFYL